MISIAYVPLPEVNGWPRNPKKHDLTAIKRSIVLNGFVRPLVMDEGTGQLVAGHGSLEAVAQLRMEGAARPMGIEEDEHGVWTVPVVRGVSFADPAAAEAYLLADNRIAELGGWDEQMLQQMLTDLDEAGYLTSASFSSADLEDFVQRLGETPTSVMDDATEEPAEEPREPRPPSMSMREVSMLMTGEQHTEFHDLLDQLRQRYGTESIPDTLLAAMREAADI